VWTLDGNTFTAHPVQVGITNGIMTEITSGLKSGQKVITEFKMNGEEEMGGTQNNNPFMPKPRQRNNNNSKK
jgi:HlyD family secretion protein